MEYTTDRLLREVIKFIETCQNSALKGKIGTNSYISLTSNKINFLKHLLIDERDSLLFDKEIITRINNIYEINVKIHCSRARAVENLAFIKENR
jgi:hypothetical protein